jgi:hypothetical protein
VYADIPLRSPLPLEDTNMTRTLVIAAAALALCVPAALGAPPADKGKPDKPGSSLAAPGQSDEKNAAKRCKAERERIGEAAFKAKYGTNANKANAFGKCVSAQAKDDADEAQSREQEQAKENAAKKCKKLRAEMGVEKFRETYGTNANGANAFGKCVSKLAKKLLDA